MSMVGFPLLLIPVAIYNIIVFLMPGMAIDVPLFKLTLMSGELWQVTLSDVLLALGMLLLMFEVIKGARPGAKFLMDHLLSLIVFGAAAAEFVMWPRFGTSTYFLLALLTLVDFLSGLALRTRRSVPVATTSSVKASKRRAEPEVVVAHEPSFEPPPPPAATPVAPPVPTPLIPAATSVAESVLRDHPEPASVQPAAVAVPAGPSSEMVSTGIHPANDTSPSPDVPR